MKDMISSLAFLTRCDHLDAITQTFTDHQSQAFYWLAVYTCFFSFLRQRRRKVFGGTFFLCSKPFTKLAVACHSYTIFPRLFLLLNFSGSCWKSLKNHKCFRGSGQTLIFLLALIYASIDACFLFSKAEYTGRSRDVLLLFSDTCYYSFWCLRGFYLSVDLIHFFDNLFCWILILDTVYEGWRSVPR